MEEKNVNLVILDTKEKLIQVMEDAKLPITVNQFIINEVKKIIDDATNSIVAKEKEKYYKSLENKESEE